MLKFPGIRARRRSRDSKAASILAPVTGDSSDDQVIALACDLLGSGKGKLYIVYVIEVERAFPIDAEISPAIAKGEEVLTHVEQVARRYKREPDAELVQARHAGSAVVQEATGRDVGTIVIGCPYRERFGSFSLGDTIPYVLENAPCAVIVRRDNLGLSGGQNGRGGPGSRGRSG